MRCVFWYHLYNLKHMKNTHGGVLLLVKLHFIQIVQMVPNRAKHHIWSSIYENFNNNETELRKSVGYKKKRAYVSPL